MSPAGIKCTDNRSIITVNDQRPAGQSLLPEAERDKDVDHLEVNNAVVDGNSRETSQRYRVNHVSPCTTYSG